MASAEADDDVRILRAVRGSVGAEVDAVHQHD